MIAVDDPADPRLADFASADPRNRRAEIERAAAIGGWVVAEGPVTVRRMATSGLRMRAILIEDRLAETFADVTERQGGAPVYVAPKALLRAIQGFDFHRGVIASADRPSARPIAGLVAAVRRVAVLEGIVDHENVGAIFRNGAAFGIDAVVLDHACADPLYRRAIRVSVGHTLTLPFARAAVGAAVEELRRAGFRILALTPDGRAASIDSVERSGRIALVFGAEGPGLSDGARHVADLEVRIPMHDRADSLNVASASAVAFHALYQ